MKFASADPQKPTAAFWELVDLGRRKPDACLARLAELDTPDLVDLYWAYKDAADLLREPEYYEYMTGITSEDGIADLASWIVAQGKEYYQRILAHPEKVPTEEPEPYFDLESAAVEEHIERHGDGIPWRDPS